jgi:predicted acyltransferase
MATTQPGATGIEGRLASLDVFRGLTMFLLVAEGALVYESVLVPELDGTWMHTVATQFTHHPWNGLRFWDLVQPFFMFIVGVAMPFAFARRGERGESQRGSGS